jgi:hypothetical protein
VKLRFNYSIGKVNFINNHKSIKPLWVTVVKGLNLKRYHMKKLLFAILVVLLAAGSGYAQPGGNDPATRLKKEMDGLTAALGLTKEQVEKITPIVEAGQKKQSELFAKMREAGGDIDREKMHDDMNKIQAETDTELKKVLTAEQSPKLDAYRKQQAEERAKRMPPPQMK